MQKILIIEDEKSLATALLDKLKLAGFEAFIARDGEEGLAKSFKEHPDLILLDIIMPKMDGISMLRKLRQDAWGANVPVIILTNLSDTESAFENSDPLCAEYLVKTDWSLADVVKKVQEKLGSQN